MFFSIFGGRKQETDPHFSVESSEDEAAIPTSSVIEAPAGEAHGPSISTESPVVASPEMPLVVQPTVEDSAGPVGERASYPVRMVDPKSDTPVPENVITIAAPIAEFEKPSIEAADQRRTPIAQEFVRSRLSKE